MPSSVVQLHVSDRILFRRCRRKWGWQSPIREHLQRKEGEVNEHLWFGSGYHFALEDWHGYRRFTRAEDAFRAYAVATGARSQGRPENWDDLCDLAEGMLSYYTDHWSRQRSEFRTFTVDGVPQVEVPFCIRVGRIRGQRVDHVGTFDRVVEDREGRLWIAEYKTAKQVDTMKLSTDPQVNAYLWAAEQLWPGRVEGVVYMQFAKQVPKLPRVLMNGTFSTAKAQKTTYAIYRAALLQQYGRVPSEYREYLNTLAEQETIEGDAFIRRDLVRRNGYSLASEDQKIRAEARDMLDPKLGLYPNPTRDCSWECPFREPCVMQDDGSDYLQVLEDEYERAETEAERSWWRAHIAWPDSKENEIVLPA